MKMSYQYRRAFQVVSRFSGSMVMTNLSYKVIQFFLNKFGVNDFFGFVFLFVVDNYRCRRWVFLSFKRV